MLIIISLLKVPRVPGLRPAGSAQMKKESKEGSDQKLAMSVPQMGSHAPNRKVGSRPQLRVPMSPSVVAAAQSKSGVTPQLRAKLVLLCDYSITAGELKT